jgi:hypothetical protein
MTHILWLASYPKSGNTWLRAFLANYRADGEDAFDINRLPEISYSDARRRYYAEVAAGDAATLDGPALATLRPAVHRLLASAQPGRVLVKTHAWHGAVDGVPAITAEVTWGAIVIVRNPLDMVVSFADHYGLPLDNAIKATAFPALDLKPDAGTVRQRIGDWSGHLRGWLGAPGLNRLVVRYEDLAAAPEPAFAKVIAFLGEAVDEGRLKRAIARSAFDSLQAQERARGFIERSKSSRRFFRTGSVGGWRRVLSPPQVEAVITSHRAMMRQMGYLTADGALTV